MPPAIIAAGISAAGAIGSSLLAGHASSQAANAQSQAAQQGITETRTDLMPWLTAGQSALGGMEGLLGLSGAGAQQSAITGLQNSPLFTSLYGQGKQAILQSAAATGGLRGGNTEHSLFGLGSDLLAQVIQQQLANLGGLSGQGLQAGGYISSAISNLLGQKGAAQAGGIMGSAGGLAGALQGVTGFLGTPGLFGGGGASASPASGNLNSLYGSDGLDTILGGGGGF